MSDTQIIDKAEAVAHSVNNFGQVETALNYLNLANKMVRGSSAKLCLAILANKLWDKWSY